MTDYTPFCGAPPVPDELWSRWTFDPVLLAGLAVALALGWYGAQRRGRFVTGWGIAALLFISPLCAASMALFSARVAQHILLTLLVAPIIAAALRPVRLPALPFAVLFAALFWAWHAPAPYIATLQSDFIYWSMHLSLLGSAVLLFATLRAAPEKGLTAAAFTGAQLTLYAMIITLSPGVWHPWHFATAPAFGISALADQQLAGGLMWVAGGALFMSIIALMAHRFVREPDRSAQR